MANLNNETFLVLGAKKREKKVESKRSQLFLKLR